MKQIMVSLSINPVFRVIKYYSPILQHTKICQILLKTTELTLPALHVLSFQGAESLMPLEPKLKQNNSEIQ